MKNVVLPDDLILKGSSDVEVYYYKSHDNISKQQVVLSKNTFSFLTEGHKEVFFNDAYYSIENNQFLLMKSGHCLMTEKLSSQSNNYISVLLFFTNDILISTLRKYGLDPQMEKKQASVRAIPYDPYISTFKESLMGLLKLPSRTRQKMLELKFEEIILYLVEIGYGQTLYSFLSQHNRDTQDLIQVVEQNQLKKLTVKELSFLCHMSVSTFKRQFEKVYGTSPIKWFQNKRLEYAHLLIHERSKRPSDIFYEVGYESLSSFIQAYKSKYGVTPKQSKK